MRIAFTAEAFADQNAHRHLDAILYLIEDGIHEWHIDDPDVIEGSKWLRGARSSYRLLFEKAATRPTVARSAKGVHSRVLLVGKHDRPASLSPAKAVQLLQKPVLVLMENRNTDGAFLNAVLAVLGDSELLRLRELGGQALKYDSAGGGGELKKLIEDEHAKSETADLPLRAVVFTDSDGRFPGDIAQSANEIRETCDRLGVAYVILAKRAIENYIPDEVISEWSDMREHTSTRERIAALLRLTPEQRDHFPFKTKAKGEKGLSFLKAPADKKHPVEEHRLYRNVPIADRDLLEWRFGDDFVFVLYESHSSPESGVMDQAIRSSLTAESLRRRDGHGELDHLVALIEEQL